MKTDRACLFCDSMIDDEDRPDEIQSFWDVDCCLQTYRRLQGDAHLQHRVASLKR